MNPAKTFQRRGIVEGFFGPLWSMAHRKRLLEFGAAPGMNTYLYARTIPFTANFGDDLTPRRNGVNY